jgi:Na+/H+-dicarboxylate symporter
MKIAKFALTTVAYAKVYLVAEAMRPESRSQISSETQEAAVILQQALQCIPDFILECVLKNYALSLGHHNAEEVSLDVYNRISFFDMLFKCFH